jgi:hypothetical protein
MILELFVALNTTGKVAIALGSGLLGLTALFVRWIKKTKGGFQPYQKSTLLYLLAFVAAASILLFVLSLLPFEKPETVFILCQLIFLSLGVLHCVYGSHYLKWTDESKSLWPEFVFLFLIAVASAIAFGFLYCWLYNDFLEVIMACSTLFFIVPFLFYQSFLHAVAIPAEVIKHWLYPVHQEVAEPDESKLKNLLIISFEFQKQSGDLHYTNFRAKAPIDMEFGQLFYYFINDYNERHPHSKIEFVSDSGEPHGWVFYKKPRWHSFGTHYINQDKTIFNNRIRENDVIICSRSSN